MDGSLFKSQFDSKRRILSRRAASQGSMIRQPL
jgi:hypothetical protein